MSISLSRETILAFNDLKTERLDVPEWGGHVFVRTMTAKQKEDWEQSRLSQSDSSTQVKLHDVRASLAALTLCDEAGQLLFTITDVEALNDKSVAALDRVFEKSMELNRVNKQDVDDLVKNSSETGDESSPSV